MPKKGTVRTPSLWDPSKFKPGDLVNVFNFDDDEINLAPQECFSRSDCKSCPGHQGSKCTLRGPKVSKVDILTVINCHKPRADLFQMILLLTPDGLIGAFDNEMLDFVPEMIPDKEKVK